MEVIFSIHLKLFELFELCTKNNQLARLSKRSLGWRLRWWHLTLWQVSFFFKQTDLFLVSCSRATPGPLDFLNIYFFGRDDTCHYQQNQQNQQMAVFLVFKGFFQKYVPSSWQKSRLAYAPQEASLLASCSIRENVLCGRPWDSQRRQCVWLLRHLGMPLVATAQLLPNVRDGELYLDRYEQALITSTLSEDGNKEI